MSNGEVPRLRGRAATERQRAMRVASVIAMWTLGAALLSVAGERDGASAVASQSDGPRQVARLTIQGLFPVERPFLPSGPRVVLYADGTVLVPDPALPTVAPQMWPYRSGRIDTALVIALLARAKTLGLLSSPTRYPSMDPRQGHVSHPSQTTVVLTTPGGAFRHVADGLSPADTDARRVALRTFVDELSDLAGRARTEPYPPTRVGIVAAVVASERHRPIVDWPSAGIDLASATRCTAVDDRGTIAFLRARPAGTHYRQGGRIFTLAARVVVPGDDC